MLKNGTLKGRPFFVVKYYIVYSSFFCIKNLDLLLLDLEDKAKDVSE